ncbi:MAG: dockerin type I repeat-containing protein, partial [Chloroflexi bacterium]|nr:dockerin type I repeat-containing protein [Chloroflexota bacterium]
TPVPPDETDTPVPPTITPVPPDPTDTPVPPKVCGDVNEDGVANSVDASLILQLKAGLISSLPNESSGDVNGDGALTSVDAALLLQFTAGLISEDGLACG